MRETEIIALLRGIASAPAARGLADDAAVWAPPLGRDLVLTHDTIVEGVHYLPADDPSDIAWKLVAVNISDLAAKGARPAGLLVSLALGNADDAWISRFAEGLGRVCREMRADLWGGDTVRTGGQTVLGATAIGHVPAGADLSRGAARAGDLLLVTGRIGDAGLGLAAQRGEAPADKYLQRRYRLPMPRLDFSKGMRAAGVRAAMDVSDGLLIDASRMAKASGLAAVVDLASLPISEAARSRLAPGNEGYLAAATSGDDYELLVAAPADAKSDLAALAETCRLDLTAIGRLEEGQGLSVTGAEGEPVTPARYGYEH